MTWAKSSYCADSDSCVEVVHDPCGQVLVRDSKHPDGPVLVYTAAEWDTATYARPGCIAYLPAGVAAWVGETADGERVWLEFTPAEAGAVA